MQPKLNIDVDQNGPQITLNVSADNIFNITLGQIDNLDDLDLATSNQDNKHESCLNESLQALFTFEEWLQEKSRL